MSKKITFQELIDAIAEESGKSKQFTHDFIKDFVSTVNDGLLQNDSVNVAGFGKFKLREMDEREGVNPQTGEKITIPSHQKAVFTPYKNLRELVNAPYEHLESELIEEDNDEANDTESVQSDTDSNKEEQQFIPTAPPPSVDSETKETEKKGTESEDVHPFLLDMENDVSDDDDGKETDSDEFVDPIADAEGDPDDTPWDFDEIKNDESEEESFEDDVDPFDFIDEEETESQEYEEPAFQLEDFSEQPEKDKDTDDKPEDIVEGKQDIIDEEEVVAQEETETESEEQVEEKEDFDDDIVEFTPAYSVFEEDENIEENSETEAPPFGLDDNDKLDDEPIEDPDEEEYEMYALPADEEEVENEENELGEEERVLNEEFNETYENIEDHEEQHEETEKAYKPPVFKDRTLKRKRNTGGNMWIIAAAIIIILLAGGSWYFLMYNNQGSSDTNDTSTASTGITTTQPQNTGPDNPATDGDSNAQGNTGKTNSKTSAANGKTTGSSDSKTESKTSSTGNTKLISHTVEKGETLWSLADVNYQDPYRWPWIYDENQPEIDNPNIIKIGQTLEIPMPQGPDGSLTNNDSLQVAIAFAETYSWYKEREMEEAKFYLYTAKKYHGDVLDYIDIQVNEDDLAFANQE